MQSIQIPLSNHHKPVTIDQQSLDELMAAGVSGNWFTNSDGSGNLFVKVKHDGKVALLSRLIAKAAHGAWVTYVNGDRFDLRRSNLRVTAKRQTPSAEAIKQHLLRQGNRK